MCFGEAVIDNCGDCTGPNTQLSFNHFMDCTGVCYGPYRADSCGVCQEQSERGEIFENRDCNGTCFGEAALDSCGVCYGGDTGEPIDSAVDACVVCFGDNTTCVGCDGEVASNVGIDTCGECGGNGCGCFKIDSITPNAGPQTGGTKVVIQGAGLFLNESAALNFVFDRNAPNCGAPYRFPVTDASITITCLFRQANSGEQRQAFAIPINQTTVRCITESTSLEEREYFVQVRVDSGPFSNPIPFYYDDYSVIRVDQLSPNSALINDSDAVLTFIGSNFLNTSAAACLIYNFQTCSLEMLSLAEPHTVPAVFINTSHYSCRLPEALAPCRVSIKLSLDGQESGILESTSTDFSFTYRHSQPQVLAVYFSQDLSDLVIEFDRSARLADSAPMTCLDVFSESTFNLIGGFRAACGWTDNRQQGITISLPSSANVMVNSPIVFRSGAVETNGTEFSFAISNATIHVVSDNNAVRPIAVIDGPNSIPMCGEFTFSAIHSQFPGYKEFDYQWSVLVEDVSTVNNFDVILDYLDALEATSDSITLNSDYFSPDVVYYLQLVVVNSAGIQSDIQIVNLTKDAISRPYLHILGSDVLQIHHKEDITLQAQIFLPECLSPSILVEYDWRLMKVVDHRRNMLIDESLVNVRTLSPLVKFPARLFESNANYVVALTASVNGQATNTDQISLQVLSPQPTAVIVGGNRTVAQDQVIVLDARNSSIDMMLSSPKFTWACDVIGSNDACYNHSNSTFPVPIVIPNTEFVTIPARALKPGQSYRFSLTLEQGAASSNSNVVISINESSAPLVEIINDDTVVLSTEEVWLQGVVYSSLSLERAYWQSIQLGQGFLNLEAIPSQIVYPSADSSIATDSLTSSPASTVAAGRANLVNLVIPANLLVPGLDYTFRLTAVDGSGARSYAEITILANSPPRLARLTATPYAGVAMETSYTLMVSGGVDEPLDTPLLYQFGIVSAGEGVELTSPLGDGNVQWLSGVQVSPSLDTMLPSGDPMRNNTLVAVVRVFDRDGSFTDSFVEVIVEPRDASLSTFQFYRELIMDLRQSLSSSKEWSEVLSTLTSAVTEINKNEQLRSSTLKRQSLELFFEIFDNHLPPASAHYRLAVSLLEQITAYGGITLASDQESIITAIDTIIEWFKTQSMLSQTATASAQRQDSGAPLLLRTTYESSAPPAFSEATGTMLLDIYLNMIEGGDSESVREAFVQELEEISELFCQESTTGKRPSILDTLTLQMFIKTSIPTGMFNISGVLVDFMDSATTLYQSAACSSTATPCLESCFSAVLYSNFSGFLSRSTFVHANQSLMLDVQSQQKLVAEIEGSNPHAIQLFSEVVSVKMSIPSQQTYLDIQNLDSAIQILIPVVTPIPDVGSQPLCLYRELGGAGTFDEDAYLWKLDVSTTPANTTIGSRVYYICEFYHLSEFAIGLLPPPVITEPPPTTTPPPTTPPTTMASTTPPQTTTSAIPVPFPVAAVIIPILLVLIVAAVSAVLVIVFFVWRKKKRGMMKIAPEDMPKKEEQPKAKLVKAGPLTPEESKIPMQIILCKGDGKERSRVGTLNVLPSIRLRELRYQLSDNFPTLKEQPFYFLTRQLCDIEPAAEQQQFVSLVFGDKPIFVREVGAETEQTRKHFCICGNAAVFECSNCGSRGYCSPECQGKHWTKEHQKECTKLSEKRKRSDILQRRVSVGEESQRKISVGSIGPLSPTTPGPMSLAGPPPVRQLSTSEQRVSLSTLASSATGQEAGLSTNVRAPAVLGPLSRPPTNIPMPPRRQLPSLSRSASLQYGQPAPGLQQAAGFLTPQDRGRPPPHMMTSTPFSGQNVSSLPFTPGRGSLQSPLRIQQPIFTQPSALRQLPTRPLAQSQQISGLRSEPLLESDENDYESSSDEHESKALIDRTSKAASQDKTVAKAVSKPTTPAKAVGDEQPQSRPPSLSVRKKRGSATASRQSEKTAESSSSSESSSSDDDSESTGSESSTEDEEEKS